MDYSGELIKGTTHQINDFISIKHPTLQQILEYGELEYYTMINSIVKTPADCMWQLAEQDIDFEEVDEFEFFMMTAFSLQQEKTEIIFGDLDFSKLEVGQNQENGELVLYNRDGLIIDRAIYAIFTDYLRQMHFLKKNIVHAGNALTKQVLIDEQKEQYERDKNKDYEPMLPSYIIALTNCSDFKYTYFDVGKLPMYVFMASLARTQKQMQYDNLMTGIYTGNVDTSKINKSELSWV